MAGRTELMAKEIEKKTGDRHNVAEVNNENEKWTRGKEKQTR